MKIAIIGSGVSGLVSAYYLAPHHTLTIFEKNNRIGGHAHTLTVKENGKIINVDNGFMVYNPERYPNFIKLLEELNVKSTPTEMSFSVTIPSIISYRGEFPRGIFAQKRNIFNLKFLRMLIDVVRFQKVAKNVLDKKLHINETLNQFIKRYNFSPELGYWFIFPMLSAIWSIKESEKAGDFPVLSTLTFLNNHKLLGGKPPQWRTIVGGSINYVSKIENHLKNYGVNIFLNTNITEVFREKSKVKIHWDNKIYEFDYVIFATHADTTLKLLKDATKDEKKALSKFTYSVNNTILHKDKKQIPNNPKLLSSWNFIQEVSKSGRLTPAIFTYCMNKLQHISLETPVLVTLNPHHEIERNKIYSSEEYAHPQYNMNTINGQHLINNLQGKNRTYFVGAHLGYGFHEDGVVSAINVINKLGINSL